MVPAAGADDRAPGPPVLGRIGQGIRNVADSACAIMFVAVFLIFCYKIARRYIPPGDAVAWADELSVILFIWIIFIANGLVVDERRQITFDLIHRNLSPGAQRFVEILRMLMIGGLFAAALAGAIDYILFLWRERTPVLLWRLDRVYLCFGLFMIAVIVRYGLRTAAYAFRRRT